jgi:predicted permease
VLVGGVSILVLLITCGNVANLLLVRGLRRDREFVVKTTLGASRSRLLREVLLEAMLVAAGAGTLALFVVTAGATMMRQLFLSPIAALASPIDARVVVVTTAFAVVSAFLLGLAPAIRLTTRRALNPTPSAMARPSRLLDVFSGVQVALSLPLVVGAALFVLSLWNARHQDFGMQTDHVVVVTTDLFELGRPLENHDAHRRMQARIARLPQVDSTALIQTMPMQSGVFFMIEVPGREAPKGPISSDNGLMPAFNGVDPSFFTLMRMRLIDGRSFTDEENRKGARSVAVITESMARIFWPGERAVGKCFYMGGRDRGCTEVVGVVTDARLYPSIRPTMQWASACYMPIEQFEGVSSRALLVRTIGDPANVLEALRRESQAAASDLPYVDVHAFDDIFTNLLRPWRLGSTVLVVFGAISMIVAAAGLAVVGAYGVTRRAREIGIRSALGASPRQLVRLVLSRSVLVVVIGLAAGTGLAWAGGRMLSAQLFDINAGDTRVFVGASLGLLLVGGLAAWIPARRAARIDPAIALRAE